jgi:hypothetical protein
MKDGEYINDENKDIDAKDEKDYVILVNYIIYTWGKSGKSGRIVVAEINEQRNQEKMLALKGSIRDKWKYISR